MSKELAEIREDLKNAIREFENKLNEISCQIDLLDLLNGEISISELELDTRAYMFCKTNNIKTIQELAEYTADELLRTPNIGRKTVNNIREQLANYKLHLNGEHLR